MFVLTAIARAIAFKIVVEIYAGHYLGFKIALSEYDAQVLVFFFSIAFKNIDGARPFIHVGFIIVHSTVLQDIFHLLVRNIAAVHAAQGMFGVNKGVTGMPIKPDTALHGLSCLLAGALIIVCTRMTGAKRERQHSQYNQ
jgi:hypothetical protein